MINEFNTPDDETLTPDAISAMGITLFVLGIALSSWFMILAI